MKRKRNKAKRFCVVMAAAVLFTVAVRANGVEYTTKTVTVAPGDTLWSLWEEHGHGRADNWINETREANNLDSADIFPGDKLTVSVIKE